MKLYLVSKTDSDGNRLWLYFFLRSALALVTRLTDSDAWKKEGRPSPWRREKCGENIVWRLPSGVAVEIIPIRLAFRDWSLRRWFRSHCHWQNLNEKGRGDVKGSILRHGRAWFKSRGYGEDGFEVAWSWNLWTHFFGADVRLCTGDGERDITFFLGCGLFAFWLTFEDAFPRSLKNWIQFGSQLNARIVETVGRVRANEWATRDADGDGYAYQKGVRLFKVVHALMHDPKSPALTIKQWRSRIDSLVEAGFLTLHVSEDDGGRLGTVYEKTTDYWSREIGVNIHNGSLWFSLWKPDGHWSSSEPQWWSFNFNPADFFLGRNKYASRTLKGETRPLVMPEGSYPVKIELKEDSWKRPRWPWAKKIVRAHMDIEKGIPTPGKGENSWDCGEDATFGLTCPANTFDEALSHLYGSVMRDRERYGGRNWLPSKRVAA